MRRWLKLDQRFPFGQTTTRIQEKFGPVGLTVWVCLLAEAKRQVPEGHVEYVTDDHFWGLLGLSKNVPGFSPEEFLTFTGQLKQTRRRRSGRVTDVVLTRWGDWQDDWRRDSERERKSRNRALSRRDTPGTESGHEADALRTEIEIEKEIENKPPLTPPGGNGVVKEIYDHWRTARGKTDPRYLRMSSARGRKITARLREFSAAELIRAIDAVALDPWEERPRHDDLTTIFRSQEQVDRFLTIEADRSLRSREQNVRDHLARLGDH